MRRFIPLSALLGLVLLTGCTRVPVSTTHPVAQVQAAKHVATPTPDPRVDPDALFASILADKCTDYRDTAFPSEGANAYDLVCRVPEGMSTVDAVSLDEFLQYAYWRSNLPAKHNVWVTAVGIISPTGQWVCWSFLTADTYTTMNDAGAWDMSIGKTWSYFDLAGIGTPPEDF